MRKNKPRTRFNCSKIEIDRFKEAVNYYTFLKLKFRRNASFICEIQVEISVPMYKYLEKKFRLKKIYQQKEELIDEFNIINQRQVSEYTTTQIDKTFFLAKLIKKKDLFNEQMKITGLCFLKLKFRKEEIVCQ